MDKMAHEANTIEIGTVINGRFLVREHLGEGGYGQIFSALDNLNNCQPVAVKVAHALLDLDNPSGANIIPSLPEKKVGKTKGKQEFKRKKAGKKNVVTKKRGMTRIKRALQKKGTKVDCKLETEYAVLKHLEKLPGFPKVFELNIIGRETYLAMELLGQSLSQALQENNLAFPLKTILLIIDQLLDRVSTVHEKGIVHCDISPANIMLGAGENSDVVYLIDFGCSAMYINPENGQHLPLRKRKKTGTPSFMSVNAHRGLQQSRRDDMESLAYVIAYLIRRTELPWNRLTESMIVTKISTNDDDEAELDISSIMNKKMEITGAELFVGQPREFAIYFDRVKELQYEQKPDYIGYQNLFRNLGALLGVKYNDNIDN